nr:reverse transcriptase domain-containing protein [Tanacetum cinerariifolium]
MDDEPMWAADRVVTPTPDSVITILETTNEFTIKGNHLPLVKGNQFDALPFVGLIYENSKKEKRIMDIDEILKFCDATSKRVLEKVKKINLDVKHGYANPALSKEDAYLMVFIEEYIQYRLKHRDQMR